MPLGLWRHRRQHERHAHALVVEARWPCVRQNAVQHRQLEKHKGERQIAGEDPGHEEGHAELPMLEVLAEHLPDVREILERHLRGWLDAGPGLRQVHLREPYQEGGAEHVAGYVPGQEPGQAPASGWVAPPATPLEIASGIKAPPHDADGAAVRVIVGDRELGAGGRGAVVHVRDLAVQIAAARVRPRARQREEGDTDEDPTAQQVDDPPINVVGHAWPIDVACVMLLRVDAHVELRASHDGHDHAARDHLRALEPENEADELVLIGRTTSQDQDQQDGVEDDPDPESREHRQHSEDPPHGVPHVAEQRLVEGQVVVEDVGPPPEGRECDQVRAQERELRVVDRGAPERCLLRVLDQFLLVDDDVRPEPIDQFVDLVPDAVGHLGVRARGLLDHLPERQQELHSERPSHDEHGVVGLGSPPLQIQACRAEACAGQHGQVQPVLRQQRHRPAEVREAGDRAGVHQGRRVVARREQLLPLLR
mmetsp:Transcript_39332/g.113830  ORF Transcript_39332/g.113830 Transcript_39332/m.113830 type:complete len:480 (-) Transcript_39332:464-1903(-)